MPNDPSEWRYTASSQEVVRTDGVLIAREVPEEFGPMVEAAPAMLAALEELQSLGEIGMLPQFGEWLTFHDKVAQIARAAIARTRQ